MAHSSLRFGIGRFTTEAEVDFVVSHIVRTVQRLRDMRWVGITCLSLFVLKLGFLVLFGRWFRRASISILLTGHSHSISVLFHVHPILFRVGPAIIFAYLVNDTHKKKCWQPFWLWSVRCWLMMPCLTCWTDWNSVEVFPTSLFLSLPWLDVYILAVRFSSQSRNEPEGWLSIWNSGLPTDARSEDVNKFFEGYGRIIDCRVMTGSFRRRSCTSLN